jgi:superfamily II DNA helicase RecQ
MAPGAIFKKVPGTYWKQRDTHLMAGGNMPLLTQFQSFFISPFGDASVSDELNRFLKSHRIVSIERKLMDSERGTGWVFLVEYGSDERAQIHSGSPKVDYKELLNEQEFIVFDKLRQFRKEIAEKQKLPVYTIFNNEQLAGMVKNPPSSLADLGKIPGIGEAKLKQYGEQFLNLFKELETKAANETDKPPF